VRRVVIVSPYFPPSTLAGVHRARLLARHLPAHGWEPVVVCVHERHHEEPLDPGLARLVPSQVRVVKTKAVPSWLARRVGVGDLSLRGWWPLRWAVHRLLGQEGADVVLITMGPFYTSLFARGIRSRFRVPVVLDYQDPWVSRWGATLPRWSKGGWSHRLATWLEPRALRQADWITAVSAGTYAEILSRHRWIQPARCTEIPIGGDPCDFKLVGDSSFEPTCLAEQPGCLCLRHVGTLLPRAGATLRALLEGVALLRQQAPDLVNRLRLDFVGTSNQPAGGPLRVEPLARELGLAELVREVPARVPYLEALALLTRAHAVLALGSDEPHYTASKLYPMLLSGRPGLALFHHASSVCTVVRAVGGAILVTYGGEHEVGERVGDIAAALERLLRHPETVPTVDQAALRPYLAPAIAGCFAEVMEQVAREGLRGLGG
jgi:hypothetical protein